MKNKFKRLILLTVPDPDKYDLSNITKLLIKETENDHPLAKSKTYILEKDFNNTQSPRFIENAIALQKLIPNSRYTTINTTNNFIESFLNLECETLILFTNQDRFSMIITQTADKIQPKISIQLFYKNMQCILVETKKPLRIYTNLF